MNFKYIASQPDGRVVENEVEARDMAEVLDLLTKQGMKPISIQPLGKVGWLTKNIFQNRINTTDQIFLSKYLALMLRIGTGLLQAINVLITDFNKPAIKAFLLEVRNGIEKGQPIFLSFARYPKIFSQVYINLIKTGEAAGNLDRIFEDLTEMLAKQKSLQDQIRGALIYPIILMVGAIFILVFLTTYALPKIASVFNQSSFNMPAFSKVVFSFGLFVGDHVFLLVGTLFGGLAAFFYFYKTSLTFKKLIVSVISGIPVINDVIKKIAVQRFASILSSLIKAGLPLTEGLEITAQAVSNIELRESLLRISREGLSKGLTIGEAFRKETFFPRVVVNLVAISEKAGRIEEVLAVLADFYTKEIDSTLKTLVAFLEPVLLIFIGAIIGLIALSIIVPIYQLTTQF